MRPVQQARYQPGRIQRLLNRVADSLLEMRKPLEAEKRRYWRQHAHRFTRSLAAASTERTMVDWLPTDGDADALTLDDLPLARQRTRDAALNDPVAKAIRMVLADYVVGSGLMPKSSIDADRLGISEGQAEDWTGAVDQMLRDTKDTADITGRCSWARLQRLCLLSAIDGGDLAVSYPLGPTDDQIRIKMNFIEAERIVDPNSGNQLIRGGVETNDAGRPIAYHIQRGHPGSQYTTRDHYRIERMRKYRVTATGVRRLNVLHVYDQDRIGQSRGVPFLAPALEMLDRTSRYLDETLLQAQLQNALSVWIETAADPSLVQASMRDKVTYDGLSEKGVRAGSINLLKQGDSAKFLTPTTPAQFFDELVVRMLRTVCASVGVSFELTFDVGQANYSSIRMGVLRFKQTIAGLQDMILPAFQAWRAHAIREAWLDGKLPPVDYLAAQQQWNACTWDRPAVPWVDPEKDARAEVALIDAGIKSRRQVIRERGNDPRDVETEILAEREVIPPSSATATAPAEPVDEDGEEQRQGESQDEEQQRELQEAEA